jgi:hypothetical protein
LKPRLTKYLMGDPLFGGEMNRDIGGTFLPPKNPLKELPKKTLS